MTQTVEGVVDAQAKPNISFYYSAGTEPPKANVFPIGAASAEEMQTYLQGAGLQYSGDGHHVSSLESTSYAGFVQEHKADFLKYRPAGEDQRVFNITAELHPFDNYSLADASHELCEQVEHGLGVLGDTFVIPHSLTIQLTTVIERVGTVFSDYLEDVRGLGCLPESTGFSASVLFAHGFKGTLEVLLELNVINADLTEEAKPQTILQVGVAFPKMI